MIEVLDKGYVKVVEAWGSDEEVIKSARMSTAKGFQGWDRDAPLLRYLWENEHLTPFEFGGLTIEAQAPIFVVREWMRHRTFSYNEMSGRYVELPDLYYIPSIERLMGGAQSQVNKQGSTDGLTESDAAATQQMIYDTTNHSRMIYERLLAGGISRELARLVIPVNQYSRFRASGNLRNWLAFLRLRQAPNAQWEIRQYASAVGTIIEEAFPRTYELFKEA